MLVCLALAAGSPLEASMTGTDVVVPSSANAAGAYGSRWVTTLWVTNASGAPLTVRLSFLQRDVSNTSPLTREELLLAGESRRYDDVVGTLFGLAGVAGAIRLQAAGEILAVSRTYDDASGAPADSLGTSLDAVPAGMAIGLGRSTTLLGADPDGSGAFRYNFGFVEVDGRPVTVRATLRSGGGAALASAEVALRPLEMRQLSLADAFPGVRAANAALDVAVASGDGRIVAFSTLIPTGSNSPTGFVMSLDTRSFVGPPGPAGPQGQAGPQGSAGPKGDPGQTGPAGPQGPGGPKGAVGLQGPAGPQGPAGSVGQQGAAGPQGPAGQQGPAGPQGPAGSVGPQGPQGAQGPAGPAGPQGPAGTLPTGAMILGPANDPGLLAAGFSPRGPSGLDTFWLPTGLGGAPSARSGATAVWTGSRMIVWGGIGATGPLDTGGVYDPVLDSWTPTAVSPVAPARWLHTAVWTGSRMVVWGGNGFAGAFSSGGRYDPVTDTWQATTTTGAPSLRYGHTAVWSGTEMIVFGGYTIPTITNSGGRYDPVADSWAATTTTGAPAARAYQTAVWTGSRMVVWGGGGLAGMLDDGGRYNPADNSWAPTSTTGVPTGRSGHSAVWTGSAMVVWGGQTASQLLQSGGRYDPAEDTWTPTSVLAFVPAARASHTAVWTGSRMIVWGGSTTMTGSTSLAPGGIYDPSADSWSPTSTGPAVPLARYGHTAVWTGSRMVLWGGWIGPGYTDTGAQLDPAGGPIYIYRKN